MSDWVPARLAEPQACRSGWKGRAAGSDPGIKATPSSFLISVKHGISRKSILVLNMFLSQTGGRGSAEPLADSNRGTSRIGAEDDVVTSAKALAAHGTEVEVHAGARA
jgi:hypothetical protein